MVTATAGPDEPTDGPPPEDSNPLVRAITAALNYTYDQVAVSREDILKATKHYDLQFTSWDDYQRRAPFSMMEQIANGYIRWTKIKVSGLAFPLAMGNIALAVPDTLQYLGFTLRMVTGIAAAYGFDPHPDHLGGKVKSIVLQAYLNGNLGRGAIEGAGKLSLGAATKFLKTVPMRTNFLMRVIVAIGKALGIRITRKLLLTWVPIAGGVFNSAFSWGLANGIAMSARKDFSDFREEIRSGKYRNDPDYQGLGDE
jgi:hypothetical protein